METPPITVVIATIATRERSATLFRAIESIRDQDVASRIVVVVNGGKADGDTVSKLKQAGDTNVLEFAEANMAKSLAAGVEVVQTDCYSVLDDDDILMPDALRKRVEFMESYLEADLLVAPGERSFLDGRTERIPVRFNASDPLTSLFDCNWLASCGGVYRRKRVGADYFASMPRYMEWTYLAFRLIRERRVCFSMDDPAPHFTVFDTAGSESKNLDYVIAMPANISRMHDPHLPVEIQRLLSDKLARALHDASVHCMECGRVKDAWRFHFASLRELNGLRYLLFTRHLVFAMLGLSGSKQGSASVR